MMLELTSATSWIAAMRTPWNLSFSSITMLDVWSSTNSGTRFSMRISASAAFFRTCAFEDPRWQETSDTSTRPMSAVAKFPTDVRAKPTTYCDLSRSDGTIHLMHSAPHCTRDVDHFSVNLSLRWAPRCARQVATSEQDILWDCASVKFKPS